MNVGTMDIAMETGHLLWKKNEIDRREPNLVGPRLFHSSLPSGFIPISERNALHSYMELFVMLKSRV